jgi:TPR repeat protein
MPFRNLPGVSMATLLGALAFSLLIAPACSGGAFEAGQQAFDIEDYELAMDRWMPFAEDGDAACQAGVAYLYEHGLGVPADYVEAVRWYRLAAEQGHASSQLNLGMIYLANREGLPRDSGRAADWLRLAAEQGNPEAQFYLGRMYYRGDGLPRNNDLAFEWLNMAAEQDEPMALNHLGILYSRGKGVEQDAEKAFGLILRAAELDVASAQLNLTTQYIRGNGTEQDFVEALKWYTVFESHELQVPGLPRDWIDNNMNTEEIAEAERRAAAWIAENRAPGAPEPPSTE